VEVQPFMAPRSYGPELILISLLLALGGWLGLWWLALVGALGFWAHFSGWWVPWRKLFDRYPSQNVLAQTGQGRKTLALMAHYDTAKTFFLYHPKRVRFFRHNFLINAALATLLPLGALWTGVSQLLGLYFLVQAVLLALRELGAPYVNGANDNATGVAVAVALFEELRRDPLPDYRVVLALTGSEEVGAKGAEFLVRSGRIPPDALVLNIDNVGQGELFYATGEGMLIYHAYRGALLERARATPGAQPLAYRLAYFDTRPFAARKIPLDREVVRARGQARLRGEGVEGRYRFRIQTKSGQTRWLDYSAARVDLGGIQRFWVWASTLPRPRSTSSTSRRWFGFPRPCAAPTTSRRCSRPPWTRRWPSWRPLWAAYCSTTPRPTPWRRWPARAGCSKSPPRRSPGKKA
jgi:hypothetical protein